MLLQTRNAVQIRMEHRAFTGAVAMGMIHAFDDAVVNRQPGVPMGQHLAALAVVGGAAALAVWWFPRLRPGLRSGAALAAGILTAANGAMHVLQVVRAEMQGSDLTGLLAFLSGLVLIGLGAFIPFRHRGERSTSPVRRWGRRVLAVTTSLVVAQLVVLPALIGLVQTHKFREAVGDPPRGFEPVSFTSTDGLRLAGWYHQSRNGAAVVVVSSASGDRSGSLRHATLLARNGYGVLTYDARGSGHSQGTPNGWGWQWEHDVSGAIDYLQSRPGVDPDRIGGLGLSTGADVLFDVAASHGAMRAVVADGATGRSFADRPPGALGAPFAWAMFAAGSLFSGTTPGPALVEVVERAAPTPILLVAAGSLPMELHANERYAAAGPSTTLWRLPEVSHTDAIEEEPAAYERRVTQHFADALLEPRGH